MERAKQIWESSHGCWRTAVRERQISSKYQCLIGRRRKTAGDGEVQKELGGCDFTETKRIFETCVYLVIIKEYSTGPYFRYCARCFTFVPPTNPEIGTTVYFIYKVGIKAVYTMGYTGTERLHIFRLRHLLSARLCDIDVLVGRRRCGMKQGQEVLSEEKLAFGWRWETSTYSALWRYF